MSFSRARLSWLTEPPADFRRRCKDLRADQTALGEAVQSLATHRLDNPSAEQLSRAIKRLTAEGADPAPLSQLRLLVLKAATYDLVEACLPAAAARAGVWLDICPSASDQIEQIALGMVPLDSPSKPDAVLVTLDPFWLDLGRSASTSAEAEERVATAIERLGVVMDGIAKTFAATVIVTSVPPPQQRLFGSYDARAAFSPARLIDAFNRALVTRCDDSGAILFDVAALAQSVGTDNWLDNRLYNLYKLPFSPDFVPLYCDSLARILGAIRGKSRKCLVLDLDNTCWGGVIGDDGIENIRIGPGSAEGESFLAVQRLALELKGRGVVLAVSSKNDDETARGPFRNHPEMLLRESDIAVFQANWNDKPSNLEAIARTLSIGLDALVFLDDNSAERAQVRAALPAVAVPELPDDPADYAATLSAGGYFEAVAFSDEDRSRAASYAANAKRAEVEAQSRDLGDYLSALSMTIQFAPFDAMNRARIAQLINKSNQFNLTSRRYSETDVAAMENGGVEFTLQTRLADRFSDFGMIGVVICRATDAPESNEWAIDTWLMSCRVLGRRVEEAMLAEVVARAKARGIGVLRGQYIPTAKNGMVSTHFDKLGFTRTGTHPSGACDYALVLADYETPALPHTRVDGNEASPAGPKVQQPA